MIQLPDAFTEKMQRLLGEEYGDFLASYGQPRRFGLRVNTLKISPEEFERLAPFHLTKIPWVQNGYYYEEQDAPARHPFYYAGLYYLQEPSAMTPASVLPVQPGERVLDLCAAPGGKATELGAKLMGSGLLVANDISASRAKALLKNIEVFGITNAFVTNETPARLSEQFPEFFDKILVDAPCSGEGMFRKDPAVIRAWDADKPLACAKQQREIIRRAADMLIPGGLLLYSTCTFSPEENEQIIAGLLAEREDMELLDIPWQEGFSHGIPEAGNGAGDEDILHLDGRADLRKCVRIFPHKMAGEGHFLALLRKRGGAADASKRAETLRRSDAPKWEVLTDFLGAVSAPLDRARLEIRKEQAYYVPEYLSNVRGLSFLRNGLYLGEIKKDRFEPSQSFAMALGGERFAGTAVTDQDSLAAAASAGQDGFAATADVGKAAGFANVIGLDWHDERVYRYLRGETIEVNGGDVCGGTGGSAASGARSRNAGGSAAPGVKGRNAGGSAAPGAKGRNAGGTAAYGAKGRNAGGSAVSGAKSWYLVCVNGYPLGWGKLSNGMLKNKYHAGWRMK